MVPVSSNNKLSTQDQEEPHPEKAAATQNPASISRQWLSQTLPSGTQINTYDIAPCTKEEHHYQPLINVRPKAMSLTDLGYLSLTTHK